jgi:hypothetical protein
VVVPLKYVLNIASFPGAKVVPFKLPVIANWKIGDKVLTPMSFKDEVKSLSIQSLKYGASKGSLRVNL